MITAGDVKYLSNFLQNLDVLGSHVIYRDALPSSQDELVRRADQVPDGTILIVRNQTRGRGRMGRRWASPPGTLTFSVLLRPRIPPSMVGMVMLAASIALHDSIRVWVPETRLKWPNDVLVGDKKVAGMLLDVSITEKTRWVVLGVGVNVSNSADAIYEQMGTNPVSEVASLVEYAPDASALEILASFLKKMDELYTGINSGMHGSIHRIYQKRCSTVGRRIVFDGVCGRAERVDPNGSLWVQTHDGMRCITCDITDSDAVL